MQNRVVFVSGSFLKSGCCREFLKSQTEIGSRGGKTGLRAFSQTRPKLKELKSATEIVQGWVKSVVGGASTRSVEGVEDTREFFKRPEGKQIDYDLKLSSSSPLSSAVAAAVGSNSRRKNGKTGARMFSKSPKDDKIVWVDCEMTSLEDDGQLMEIGIIITEGNLEEIARHDPIVFKIEDSILDKMNDWCREHHGKSGLTDSCRTSNVTHAEADDQILSFLEKYTTARECPIAGNSIGVDRIFITKQLPKVHAHLHYRSIDVSSIKELARRWYPVDVIDAAPKKRFSHRVMDDIEDSIAELRYYRSAVFIDPKSVKPSQSSNVLKTKAKNTAV